MSKINAVRFVNIHYNDHTCHIADEIFYFNGESTLLALDNGGGKSVLVQMMTAPFVTKRYRNVKDRPFSGYFSSSSPSFIMVEWDLENHSGYLLNGIMVRKNPSMDTEDRQELEITGFVSEYLRPCEYDIRHLPVIIKENQTTKVNSYGNCCRIFETYKKDRNVNFFYYDLNISAQSRQYFRKLQEYSINQYEWQNIIRRINEEESGLSRLFQECRDERSLTEKWFLSTVEKKINRDKDRIGAFREILEKYFLTYRENKSKFQQKDAIELLEQKIEPLQEKNKARIVLEKAGDQHLQEIAAFRDILSELHTEADSLLQLKKENENALRSLLHATAYEKESMLYYQIFHRKEDRESLLTDTKRERQRQVELSDCFEQQLNILHCAEKQEKVNAAAFKLKQIDARLDASLTESQDLQPEINWLGNLLNTHYSGLYEENQSAVKEKNDESETVKNEILDLRQKIEALQKEEKKNLAECGKLQGRIDAFDQTERNFNKKHHQHYSRNILGEYPLGFPEADERKFISEKAKVMNAISEQQHLNDEIQQDLEGNRQKIIELEKTLLKDKFTLESLEKQQAENESVIRRRKDILKYLNLPESALFDNQKISDATERRLASLRQDIRKLSSETAAVNHELQSTLQGRLTDIPDAFIQILDKLGITPVFGLDWLKRNDFSESENRAFTDSCPVLPYALIIPDKDIELLRRYPEKMPSSPPIPILSRESLVNLQDEMTSPLVSFKNLHFYTVFDHRLLTPSYWDSFVGQLKNRLTRKEDQRHLREEEYRGYLSRLDELQGQKITAEAVQTVIEHIEKLHEKQKKDQVELTASKNAVSQLEIKLEEIRRSIAEDEQRRSDLENLISDFEQFKLAYEKYIRENHALKAIREKAEKIAEELLSHNASVSELHIRESKLKDFIYELKLAADRLKPAYDTYKQYSFAEKPEKSGLTDASDISAVESRYQALLFRTSGLQQELTRQRLEALKNLDSAEKTLARFAKKTGLMPEQWQNVQFSYAEEESLEREIRTQNASIDRLTEKCHQTDKEIAMISQRLEDLLKTIQKQYNEMQPMDEISMHPRDYDSEIILTEKQIENIGKEIEACQTRLTIYDSQLDSLAEFHDVICRIKPDWHYDFSGMSQTELRYFSGKLKMAFSQNQEAQHHARQEISKMLDALLRIEWFKDDFFRKALDTLPELLTDGERFQEQLEIISHSFGDLLEKLKIDLDMVEKEKAHIIDLLIDYVREIHDNLGKIDRNSTITIQGRPVKMLRIHLDDWLENEKAYHLRAEDFLDQLSEAALNVLASEANFQEFTGKRITTPALYDAVVGISSVGVQLHKIEAERQRQISWSEVAKNSGGEGFVSAFVILSSLLYYMRRDETDIFADSNEGKVLLMDNPFAQTNAAHLLVPLMEMAKKNNTQLICLSGLGGESIYDSFDNIYVLNLVGTVLNSGQRYLKSRQIRGEGDRSLQTARFQVIEDAEQQSMLF